jgi:hypothetical protein
MNIQLEILPIYIHCLLYWYPLKAFVMLIEYLVGNNWVI